MWTEYLNAEHIKIFNSCRAYTHIFNQENTILTFKVNHKMKSVDEIDRKYF